MKAISVKQPWAYLLCAGIKPIENRTWILPEKYKGERVLIHASGKTDKEPYMLFDDAQIEAIGNDIMDVVASYHNTSAIIGSVVFTDCAINHQSVWAEKTHMAKLGEHELPSCLYHPYKPTYNWVASDPILFDKPIPAKGKLSFWNFDIPKDGRHHHYWIEDGILYETYSTIRGNRYRELYKVNYPDRETVSDEELSKIEILNAL